MHVGRPTGLGAQRALQVALGLIWLADGALQFQPFMFGRSFVTTIIAPSATGQPAFVASPVRFAAHLMEPRVALFNAFAATIQVLIGVGLLYRPAVKAALLASFGWALGVWWIGEGLGGLATGAATPLTGAPGAALLYALAGLLVWPRTQVQTGDVASGGLLGERRARAAWAVLWFGLAALWLLPANRARDAVQQAIASAPSGARWLTDIQTPFAQAAAGQGLTIAILAAVLSTVIGLAVLFDRWVRSVLAMSVVVALLYFIVGQGMGGILTGAATDPGSGPLLILLAASLYPFDRRRQPRPHGHPPLPSRQLRRRDDPETGRTQSPFGHGLIGVTYALQALIGRRDALPEFDEKPRGARRALRVAARGRSSTLASLAASTPVAAVDRRHLGAVVAKPGG